MTSHSVSKLSLQQVTTKPVHVSASTSCRGGGFDRPACNGRHTCMPQPRKMFHAHRHEVSTGSLFLAAAHSHAHCCCSKNSVLVLILFRFPWHCRVLAVVMVLHRLDAGSLDLANVAPGKLFIDSGLVNVKLASLNHYRPDCPSPPRHNDRGAVVRHQFGNDREALRPLASQPCCQCTGTAGTLNSNYL